MVCRLQATIWSQRLRRSKWNVPRQVNWLAIGTNPLLLGGSFSSSCRLTPWRLLTLEGDIDLVLVLMAVIVSASAALIKWPRVLVPSAAAHTKLVLPIM